MLVAVGSIPTRVVAVTAVVVVVVDILQDDMCSETSLKSKQRQGSDEKREMKETKNDSRPNIKNERD